MHTDQPTEVLYFSFALTYCRLEVYKPQIPFALNVLKANNVELTISTANTSWQDIDTRILLDLVARALPEMLLDAIPKPQETVKRISQHISIVK